MESTPLKVGLLPDPHRIFASAYYNVPLEDVTKEQRQEAKRLNYWRLYSSKPKDFDTGV